MQPRYAGNPDVDAYISGVLSGRILACKWVRLTVERHVYDLSRPVSDDFPYVFDEDRAQLMLDFYPYCAHVEGELAGQAFHPLPWQQFVDWVVYGWVHYETRDRRIAEGWCEITRGGGKSFWSAAKALGMMAIDGEPGAKVFSAATKEDQAAIVWGCAAQIVRQSPDLDRLFEVHESVNNRMIRSRDSMSVTFRPIAADSKTADGLNPHMVVNDEVHEHRNRKLYMKLKTAMGKRRQPLLWNITTAGDDDIETLYDELRDHAEDVLQGWQTGAFVDERFFAVIYALDEGDDPFDESLWPKANPSLGSPGVAVKIAHLREMANRATRDPEAKRDFLRMHCGLRTTAITKAIPPDVWDACKVDVDWSTLDGADCIVAFDLSSTRDLTAIALLFPRGDDFLYRWFCFLPAMNILQRCRDDSVPYDRWAAEGWLTLTEGDQVDDQVIARKAMEIAATYNVLQWTYDPWHAVQLGNTLQREAGIEVIGYRQDLKNFGAATMHFLDETFTSRTQHDGNPLVRWCSGNVVTKEDADGNKRFHKRLSRKRIDPMTAATMTRGRLLTAQLANPLPSQSATELNGLAVL